MTRHSCTCLEALEYFSSYDSLVASPTTTIGPQNSSSASGALTLLLIPISTSKEKLTFLPFGEYGLPMQTLIIGAITPT